MALQFNGATTTTKIEGGLGLTTPSSTQTINTYHLSSVGAAVTEFVDVPVGKRAIIVAVSISGTSNGYVTMKLDAAGVTSLYLLRYLANASAIAQGPIYTIAAGEKGYYQGTAGASVNITYILEDV